MEDISTSILLVLGLIAFANYRNHTLGQWLRAKFLNSASPSATPSVFEDQSSSAATSSVAYQTGLGGGLGGLLVPVSGPETDPFGAPRPGGRTHAGVDIGAATGTTVEAARGGVVTWASPQGAYGNLVQIDHGNGIQTLYGHLSAIDVKVGQQVAVGQPIGLVGATGDATGPHLHFELRDNGKPINPAPYLGWTASTPAPGVSI